MTSCVGAELVSGDVSCIIAGMLRLQVYYVAKQCSQKCTAEEYAIALGKHFVSTYPEVGAPLACAFPSCCKPAGSGSHGILHCLMHQLNSRGVQVTKAKIWIEQKPWQRVSMGGKPHDHGTSSLLVESLWVHDPAGTLQHCMGVACNSCSCTSTTSDCLLQATR